MDPWNADAYLDRVKTLLVDESVSMLGPTAHTHRDDVDRFATAARKQAVDFVAQIERLFGDVTPDGPAFVDGFAWSARGLALTTVRAMTKGHLDHSVATLAPGRRQQLVERLLDRYCALNGRLGLSDTALRRPPILYVTAGDIDQLLERYPHRSPSVISHFALHHRRDPAQAAARFDSRCVELEQLFPDLPASIIEHIAMNNPNDSVRVAREFELRCTTLIDDYPTLQPGTVRYFALRNPSDPVAAIERALAARDRLVAADPTVPVNVAERAVRIRPQAPDAMLRAIMATRVHRTTPNAAPSRGL